MKNHKHFKCNQTITFLSFISSLLRKPKNHLYENQLLNVLCVAYLKGHNTKKLSIYHFGIYFISYLSTMRCNVYFTILRLLNFRQKVVLIVLQIKKKLKWGKYIETIIFYLFIFCCYCNSKNSFIWTWAIFSIFSLNINMIQLLFDLWSLLFLLWFIICMNSYINNLCI